MKRQSIEEGNELPADCVRSSLSTTKRQRDVVLPAVSVSNAPVLKQKVQPHQRTQKSQNIQKSAALRPGSSNPTQVLLVRVSHIAYPVSIDALHAIFSRYGEVCKVVTFDKGAGFQALIQFASVQEATQAHSKADGMCMYPGCNHIRVGFSNQSEIIVKTNSERGWDYMQERSQSGPPPPFVGDGNVPQQQEVPYLLPSPISAFPPSLLQPQNQVNELQQRQNVYQQRLHPQQGPYYPVGHPHPVTRLQQLPVRQYLPHVQYAVVPVPPSSGPPYYSSQVMNQYASTSPSLPPPAMGCSELNWQGDVRVASNMYQQHQHLHNMGSSSVPFSPQLQGNLPPPPPRHQSQMRNSQDGSTLIRAGGVPTEITNEIGVLQSHVGKEEHWQEVDGGNNDPTNDLEQQQQQPDNEDNNECLVDCDVPYILNPPQLFEIVDCWAKEDISATEYGQTATDTDKLAVATARVSFIDEEEDVEQEDLVIQGEKPVQTKHQAPQYVLQREVRPQGEDLGEIISEDVECPWDVANDMAQKDGFTAMLLVQGFNALYIKASAIAQLFGCYGDVLKVMVQSTTHQNDCASALVRMRHSAQAQQAAKWLDGQPLGEGKISVVATTDSEISGGDLATTCIRGDSSWFYRFSKTKGPGDKRYQEALCPPSPVIVLGSLPEESTEEAIASLIESIGGLISVHMGGTDTHTRTAILQFDRLENAIHALIFTHGLSWRGNRISASFMNPCMCLAG